jgi:hypothetical protein
MDGVGSQWLGTMADEAKSQDNRADRSHDGKFHAFWRGRIVYANGRLNSMLCERCLAMAFIFRKPTHPVKSLTATCPAPGAHSSTMSD